MNEPATIQSMFAAHTIAVIGLSDDPAKPSHYVSAYMQQHGYRILPVNPSIPTALGEKSYPSLTALCAELKPDVVDVFRLPKFIHTLVDEMIQLGLKNLWIQQGIVDKVSAARAEAAGIHVVMDRCIMVEHRHRTRHAPDHLQ